MPTQGWKQFLTARTRVLAAYDIAKEQEGNRQVKTRHGLAEIYGAIEASLRVNADTLRRSG